MRNKFLSMILIMSMVLSLFSGLNVNAVNNTDVKSIEAYLNYEFVDGYTGDVWGEQRYAIPFNLVEVTVNYVDGTSETRCIRDWEGMSIVDNQETDPWHVGKNYVTVEYGAHNCQLEVIVKSNSFSQDYHNTTIMSDNINLEWNYYDCQESEDCYTTETTDSTYVLRDTVLEVYGNKDSSFFTTDIIAVAQNMLGVEVYPIGITSAQDEVFVTLGDSNVYKMYALQTKDGKKFEKINLPENLLNYAAEYEFVGWEINKYKNTYVLSGTHYLINDEPYYYVSSDLKSWKKCILNCMGSLYCACLDVAAITENGVYFKLEKYRRDPCVYGSWYGQDIYFTGDFNSYVHITDCFKEHVQYSTQTGKTENVEQNSLVFIASQYGFDEYGAADFIDKVSFCVFNEDNLTTEIIETINEQPTNWYYGIGALDPRDYFSSFGNIGYTFSVNEMRVLQRVILPFDVKIAKSGSRGIFDTNNKTYYYDIVVTGDYKMYISDDYFTTAFEIDFPSDLKGETVRSVKLFKAGGKRYLRMIGTSKVGYCDFEPILNKLNGIPVISNDEYDVSISQTTGKVLPDNAELVVELLENNAQKVQYEIHIKSDKITVQPKSVVNVKMLIPDGFDKNKISVYRIENDGSKTKMRTLIDGEYLIFATSHFSKYEIVTENNLPATIFPDVDYSAWYGKAVSFASSSGLITGYANGKFGTADNIQRQDFVVILARLSGDDLSAYKGQTSFKDVSKGAYYAAALAWAKDKNVSSGYANGKFGVGDRITREQIMTFLYNYAKKIGKDVTVTEAQKESIRSNYADFGSISAYAKDATYWALSKGVISGKDAGGKKLIAPKANALRCEVAAMFYNIDSKGVF